ASPASADLTGTPSVTVAKSFEPEIVVGAQPSTMTITIANASATSRALSANFNDAFPAQIRVASPLAVATTCLNAAGTGPATIQDSGGSSLGAGDAGIRLPSGSQIPPGGCTITVSVNTTGSGTFTN